MPVVSDEEKNIQDIVNVMSIFKYPTENMSPCIWGGPAPLCPPTAFTLVLFHDQHTERSTSLFFMTAYYFAV